MFEMDFSEKPVREVSRALLHAIHLLLQHVYSHRLLNVFCSFMVNFVYIYSDRVKKYLSIGIFFY